MSTYEIFLLLGALTSVLTALSFVSALVDGGSVRSLAILIVLSVGFLYVAKSNTDGPLNPYDIPPAINKLISKFT